MNMTTKKDIYKEHLPAWLKAHGDRKKLGEITDHICFVTGMHRNSVPRKFRMLQIRDPLRTDTRGRSTYYTPDVTAALKEVWIAGDEACGELLHPQIEEYINTLVSDGLWGHSDKATTKLRTMSEHTVRRRITKLETAWFPKILWI